MSGRDGGGREGSRPTPHLGKLGQGQLLADLCLALQGSQ